MGPIRTILLSAIALGAVMAPAGQALADVAFGPARDAAVPVEAIALSILGPGSGLDPATGASVPVQRVALLAADPAQAVTVVALGRSGDAVGAPSVGALPAGSQPRTMVTADLDGDGRPEVITSSGTPDAISVFSVPDAGGPLPAPRSVFAGLTPLGLAVADLVGDANPDVAVVNDDGVAVLAGDGAGGLGPPQVVLSFPREPISIAFLSGAVRATDLTGDGRADLIVPSVYLGGLGPRNAGPSTRLGVYAAMGGGAFAAVPDTFPPAPSTGANLGTMQPADMDGDGVLDLILAGTEYLGNVGNPVTPFGEIRFGDGSGHFGTPVYYQRLVRQAEATPFGPITAAPGDLDLDGRPDLVTASGQLPTDPPALEFRRGLAGRQLADPVSLSIPAATGLFAPLDLSGDGAPDLVLGRGSAPGTIAVALARPLLAGSGQDFGAREVESAGPVLALTVENRGVAPVSITGVAVSGGAAGGFTIVADACSARVLAGGTGCVLGVRFRPSALGRRDAQVVVSGGDGLLLALSGTGVAPAPPPPAPGPGAVPTARAGCATRPTNGRMRLRCGLVLGPGATVSRVALRLVRRGRVRALVDLRSADRLVLRARRPLSAGRYTLVAVVVVADGRTGQTRRQATIRP